MSTSIKRHWPAAPALSLHLKISIKGKLERRGVLPRALVGIQTRTEFLHWWHRACGKPITKWHLS